MTTSLMRAKVALATSALALATLNPSAHADAPAPASTTSPRTVAMAVQLVASVTSDGSSQTVGVADAYLYTLSQTQLVNQLNQIRSLGVTDLRIVVPWIYIQPTSAAAYDWSKMDNVINTANAMGFTLTASITGNPTWDGTPLVGAPNPAAYATFAAAVAQRYGSQVAAYEVWNEPNAVTFFAPSDPAAYTAVLKAAYTAIKAVNPSATVIAGVLGAVTTVPGMSLAPQQFLAGMYAAGAQGFFDALSFHPYNYTLPFSAGAGVTNSPLEQVKALYALMTANGDAAKQIWATEFGNPTMPGGISQTQQAQMLRDFITAWSNLSFAGPAFVYTTRDLNTGFLLDENNMGLFTTAGLPKLAAQTLATIIKQLASGTLPSYTAPQTPVAQTIWVQLVSLAISVTNQALFIPNIATQILYHAAPAPLRQAFSALARTISLSTAHALNAITPAAETGIGMLINFPTNAHDVAKALGASFYGTEVTVQRALASVGIGAVPKPTPADTAPTAAAAVPATTLPDTSEPVATAKPAAAVASTDTATPATTASASGRTHSPATVTAPIPAPNAAPAAPAADATAPTPATTATPTTDSAGASPSTAADANATPTAAAVGKSTGRTAKPAKTAEAQPASPNRTTTTGTTATHAPQRSSEPNPTPAATGTTARRAGKHSRTDTHRDDRASAHAAPTSAAHR